MLITHNEDVEKRFDAIAKRKAAGNKDRGYSVKKNKTADRMDDARESGRVFFIP